MSVLTEHRRRLGLDPPRLTGLDVLRGANEWDSPRPWLERGHKLPHYDPWNTSKTPIGVILKENARVRREGSHRVCACAPRYGTTAIVSVSYRWIKAFAAYKANRRDSYVKLMEQARAQIAK